MTALEVMPCPNSAAISRTCAPCAQRRRSSRRRGFVHGEARRRGARSRPMDSRNITPPGYRILDAICR
jgi:hypothetical protein